MKGHLVLEAVAANGTAASCTLLPVLHVQSAPIVSDTVWWRRCVNTPVEGAPVGSMSLESSVTAVKMATSMLQLGVGLVSVTQQVQSRHTNMHLCVMCLRKLLALFEIQGPVTQVDPVIQ